MNEDDIERLMQDTRIIRNRLKLMQLLQMQKLI